MTPIRYLRAPAVCVVATLAVAALVVSTAAHAQVPDSLRTGKAILFIGRLNTDDCFADTVYGDHDAHFNYLPRLIVWGQAPGLAGLDQHQHDSIIDCLGRIPAAKKVAYTTIHYPAITAMRGSVAFESFNRDTITDMLLTLRGTAGQGEALHDSTRILLVFGQRGLDTIATLDLASISGLHTDGFIALEMRRNHEIINPRARDLTRRTSWEIPSVDQRVDDNQDTARTTGEPAPSLMRVVPNPASATAEVQVAGVPPGRYDVDVVTMDGAVVHSQSAEIGGGDLLRQLDVSRLASGAYLVRLKHAGATVTVVPIVVRR